ncbi:DEAD/DEAH box helicase [Haladaptatus sp. YSMS36]|uniref:DEAD/DEAH box helicase n=1 Tax=Haladaptatus sp. YSMS36 TaxID=3033384 RepID=UPI0023E8EBB7|nr:DEAD/DEAH box helicase [Haladaptatus sp. YSMS36]
MHTPQDTLSAALGRAAEITWWNRAVTKLNQVEGITNANTFVKTELIEQKGPYVEFVKPPAFHDQPAVDFLADLDYSPAIGDAIVEELFGGDSAGSLYQHQAETIEAIETTNNDNILAVPTAAGKTESFFLPILNYCLSCEEDGLKALVVYPMKTLGVDQLNRFITYLDHINRDREPEDRVTIGIWDGDTPQRVGTQSNDVEKGAYIRGLVDPRDPTEKLRVMSDTMVGTDEHRYSWIRTTRDGIRQGVDILLSNPEALDYMFLSNNDETRKILGNQPGANPLKHIVFDEAHVWSGIQGSSISLLSQRLKAFFKANDPQITMVSATVENPPELAGALTGNRASTEGINSIGFTAREFPVRGEPDFTRFGPCTLTELVVGLAVCVLDVDDATQLGDDVDISGALKTLRAVGLVDSNQLTIAPGTPEWVTGPIERTANRLCGDEFETHSELVKATSGRNRLVEAVIDSSGFTSGWNDFVLESVPEVAAFTQWFESGTTGAVEFKSYDDLLSEAADRGSDSPQEVIETVMAFGRLAGIVTEKYHVFLKPPHKVYWCRECELVGRTPKCQHCGQSVPEIQFCRNCHEPFSEVPTESDEPVFNALLGSAKPGTCPGCGGNPRLSDVGVPTASLLSYMLTEICREVPSKKTLVFSDSHSSAESVGDKIIETEYGLMAQTLYLQELIAEGGRAHNNELYLRVANRLKTEYWDPLVQNEIDEDSTAYNFLLPLQKTVRSHASLFKCEAMLNSALVTTDVVADRTDPVDQLVAHEAYKLFVLSKASFTLNRVKFDGLTRDKLLERLTSRLSLPTAEINAVLDEIIADFYAQGIISILPFEEVQSSVDRSQQDPDKIVELKSELDKAKTYVDEMGIVNGPADSGIFTRELGIDDTDLVLLPDVAFCSECYTSHPVTSDGEAVSHCQKCTAPLTVYSRFTTNEEGTVVASPGYANAESGWDYAIDHWAHDITDPIRDGAEPEFVSVGIHKGNIPHTVRGAIEEGFRKDDPEVNIVSATPTMELGVDIGSLDTVAQVGVPPTLTNYVQRAGRTGRSRGSSSLVMTLVRGQHPVDGHYYANLESFLKEFEPVRVPDPYDFDELLAGHVVTEVFAYLARNPHESNIFLKKFKISEPERENLVQFVNSVTKNIAILVDFIQDEMADVLREYIESIFGQRGGEVFDTVFFGDGTLSILTRTDQTFGRLAKMSSGAAANRDLTQNTSRLDQWLNQLGYLANYRSFGQNFPVKYNGQTDEISFEGGGRLYDLYPGEQNGYGAMTTLHGTDYLVEDVRGTPTSLATVALCTNEECGRRFQSYDDRTETCPHCESELVVTDIHGVASVECKLARGGQTSWRTYPQMSTHVDWGDHEARASSQSTMFGIPCTIDYGQFRLTDFVYAFERGHSMSPTTDLIQSEALIETEDEELSSSSSVSWRDEMEADDAEQYRPVGQQYHTQGLRIEFDRADFEARYSRAKHETRSWPQALTSLEQAVNRAIAVEAECDLQDFRLKTSLEDDVVELIIVDSRQGGNGITWHIFEELDGIESKVRNTASCTRCIDYCDECLLLERTPAHYLQNDLLDHRMLTAIVEEPHD